MLDRPGDSTAEGRFPVRSLNSAAGRKGKRRSATTPNGTRYQGLKALATGTGSLRDQ